MTISIANVSLPQMQGALSATQDQIAWVVTFNIVATAVVTPMSGWLEARFGRRRLILWSIATFALASLGCGLATSLEALVLFRIFQGGCGAPLVPVSQSMVLDAFPKEQHGTVTAIYGMGVIVGPIVGPVIGGYLSEAYNWRWVFFMILPFTALALAGSWVFVYESASRVRAKLDWIGLLALAVGIACLQLMLDRGQRLDWFESGEIILYAGLSAAALYVFIVHTIFAKNPFLPVGLVQDRNYMVGLVLVLGFGMLNFTPMTLLPPLLQSLGGHPDSIIGVVLSARGLGTLTGFAILAVFSKVEPKLMLTLGFVAQAISGLWMAQLDLNLSMPSLFWSIYLQGLGVGLLWVPLTVIAFARLKPALVSDGMAFFHLLRNVGSSVHISLSVALVIRSTQVNYAEIGEHVSRFNENWLLPWVSGAWSSSSTQGLAAISSEVGRQATMIGYINAFYFFALTALVILPLLLLIRR